MTVSVMVPCRCGEPAKYWVQWPEHGRHPMCYKCARSAADTASALGWTLTAPDSIIQMDDGGAQ